MIFEKKTEFATGTGRRVGNSEKVANESQYVNGMQVSGIYTEDEKVFVIF